MSKTIRFFTKKLLTKANAIAVKRGYNRTLRDDFISKLPDTLKFPIISEFVHSHKKGKECEPHVRVMVVLGGSDEDVIALDCDWSLYYQLPVATLD